MSERKEQSNEMVAPRPEFETLPAGTDVQELAVDASRFLVVKYPTGATPEDVHATVKHFQEAFSDPRFDRVPWVVVREDFEVLSLDQERMLEHGWVRNSSKGEDKEELVRLRKLAQMLAEHEPVPVDVGVKSGSLGQAQKVKRFMLLLTPEMGQEMARLMGGDESPQRPKLMVPKKKLILPGGVS